MATGNAGSSAAPKPPQQPTTPPSAAASCELPTTYARAARATLELTWPETLGILGGTGKVVLWAKVTHTRSSTGALELDVRPCGALFPEATTTLLAGGLKSSTQIPPSAFESPNMPTDRITVTQRDDRSLTFTINMVLGAMLSDPEGAWPSSANLVASDHDGDGSPGVTVLPLEGPEYGLPPSSVAQTEFLDRMSIAARIQARVSVAPACSGAVDGTVEPLAFNNSIVGCHVKDRDDCTASELRFIANGSPRYMLGQSGSWTEVEVSLDASCAEVRAVSAAP